MKKTLQIYYTSDVHGSFSPTDYATGAQTAPSLAACMAQFQKDGNTLVIDGGDTLQGSPFTYWLYHQKQGGACVPAQMLNLGGYDFITLGNHDFDYGRGELERFLSELDAQCLCANVEGIRGVRKTAVVTLENGLRVGLTGVTTAYVTNWEKPETMAGIRVTDAFGAAWSALGELHRQRVDVTVCIYHGGFEIDPKTGGRLSQTDENQGWRMCQELGFDVLLTAHQHMAAENLRISGTYACQPPDKARAYAHLTVTCEGGHVQASSRLLPSGTEPLPAAIELLAPHEDELAAWLDTPVGSLDVPITVDDPLAQARDGSLLSNFTNQVQLAFSGADISAAGLAGGGRGLPQALTIRDIVSVYAFPNTLKTIRVRRAQLKAALERSMSYFSLADDGTIVSNPDFHKPIVQHFNYDSIFGLDVDADLRQPIGSRVTAIRYQGQELDEKRELLLCLNSYRASGAGGYPAYAGCPLVSEVPVELSELVMQYVQNNKSITVDQTRWLHILQNT